MEQKEFEKQLPKMLPLQRFSSIYRVSQAMGSTIELEGLIDLIMDSCIEELKADTGSLMLLDEKTGVLTIRSARGLTDNVIKKTKIKLGEGIAGKVAQSKESLLLIGKIKNQQFDTAIDRTGDTISRQEKIASALCVPLIVKDKVRGVISLNKIETESDFTYEDLGLLCLFASQAASSIENAELYAQAQERIKELSRINHLSQSLNITQDKSEIFSLVAETLSDIVKFDACFFLLYQEDDDLIIDAKITRDLSEELLDKTKITLFKLFSDLVDFPLDTKKIIFKVEKIEHIAIKESCPCKSKRFVSSVSLPLVVRGSVIGIFNISSLTQDAFTDDNLKIMSTLAYTSSVSLDNTRLYNKMGQKIKELSTLFEVGKTISSTLDLEKVLALILEVSARIMDASICSLRLLRQEHDIVLSASSGLNKVYFKEEGFLEKRKSIAQQAIKKRKPIVITNISQDNEYIHPDYAKKEMVSSLACVPLISRGKEIGVLTVYSAQTRRYNADQIDLLSALADQAAIAVTNATLHEEIHQTFLNTVKALAAAVEAKDPYTRGHCDMVEKYAVEIAKELGLQSEHIEKIQIAAILHDIGKIGVKEDVLLKPGKLTDEEFEIIKSHPTISAKILGPANFPDKIMAAVKFHHEQIDGKGYPNNLTNEEIPIEASIVKVADAFCAMNSDRPYRQTLPFDVILNELKKDSGIKFDSNVIDALLKVLEKEKKSL